VISWAPVAQLDRASDYGSEGWGFESLRARLKPKARQPVSGVSLSLYNQVNGRTYWISTRQVLLPRLAATP
jgi:hypothetical protein